MMKIIVLVALLGFAVCSPLDQIKSDLEALETDIQKSGTPAFLDNSQDSDDDASASLAEEARIKAVVAEQPDTVEFGDDPGVEEDDASSTVDTSSSEEGDDASSSLCSVARGVCMPNADRDCRAPRSVRRGLCPGTPDHVRCCVGSGEGGQTNNGNTQTVATNANWLTEVGGIRVTKLDRSGRGSFPAHRPNKFVVHTTEGWWPRPGIEGSHSALDGKRVWSHFLIGAAAGGELKVYQYLPLNVRSSALKRNNLHSIQVEVSALTCCPFTDYDKKLTDLLRALFTAVRAAVPGIKNEVISPSTWARPVRFTVPAWEAASGITGHMFAPVPDNHNDPGHINPGLILSGSGAGAVYKSTEDMHQCLKRCTRLPHIANYYRTRTPTFN